MILKELGDLYDRLAADPELSGDIPLSGWSVEKVAWAIVLDRQGSVVGVVPQGIPDEKGKLRPSVMLVPEHDGRSGKNPKPYFLCDKAAFLLGLDENQARGEASRGRSRDMHLEVLERCDDDGARSVLAFFDRSDQLEKLSADQREALGLGGMLVFCLDRPGNYVHERAVVKDAWHRYCGKASESPVGHCSVTGEEEPLARLFPQVAGLPGAQSSGASLVSFNFNASESYGKSQAYNASISEDAAFKAGTALKYLLGSHERRIDLGSTIVTYWSDRPAPLENMLLASFLNKQRTPGEDKEVNDAIKKAFDDMLHGRPLRGFDTNVGFCILGVSPNAARLSVRFFERATLGQLAENYGNYLRDTAMDGVKSTSIWGFLLQTASLGKSENVPTTLVTRSFEAMLGGSEFPRALDGMVLSRMRADHAKRNAWDMGQRAALLKACRVRRARRQGLEVSREEQIEMALNEENTNVGYLMGRLFAVMEHAQRGALGETNATIRDRYFSSAAATPRRVMAPLMRGYSNHVSALRKQKPGVAVILEREVGSIMGLLPGDEALPKTLDVEDQSAFFIGFYQEREHLWSRNADKKTAAEVAVTDSKED